MQAAAGALLLPVLLPVLQVRGLRLQVAAMLVLLPGLQAQQLPSVRSPGHQPLQQQRSVLPAALLLNLVLVQALQLLRLLLALAWLLLGPSLL